MQYLLTRRAMAPIVTMRPGEDERRADSESRAGWADVVAVATARGSANGDATPCGRCESFNKPMVWDADALNLLAFNPDKRSQSRANAAPRPVCERQRGRN
ncbi:hypothetical protein MJ579_02935 [Klebsiella pneumoniae]|nr:hypothetical protein MJ579_02935 [Klebsiella pneumoniae]